MKGSIVPKLMCRACLIEGIDMLALFEYNNLGSFAEMLTACTNIHLEIDKGFPEHICKHCASSLKNAYQFKLLVEQSDQKLHEQHIKHSYSKVKRISFDNINNVKSKLEIKEEPTFDEEFISKEKPPDCLTELKTEIKLHNTVIKKVDANILNKEIEIKLDPDITWSKIKAEKKGDDSDDDFWANNDSDDEYIPNNLKIKTKSKFKKPKLESVKVFRKKSVSSKPVSKALRCTSNTPGNGNTTFVTCYPVLQNGQKGTPVMMKRPRDANVFKFEPGIAIHSETSADKLPRPIKRIRQVERVSKQREKLICPVCGILTLSLEAHLNTHNEKKKHKCPQCEQSFNQKGNMLTHLKKHTGHRDQICEVCGASFFTKKSLIRHNLIHLGNRTFQCDMCPKSFLVNCDLTRHKKIHAGYKPYKCTACTMSFNAKHQLQAHQRMHTGERPFSCQICELYFAYKVNLNNHAIKVHQVNLKFKSIHTITEEILDQEHEITNMACSALQAQVVANRLTDTNNTHLEIINDSIEAENNAPNEDIKDINYEISVEGESFQSS